MRITQIIYSTQVCGVMCPSLRVWPMYQKNQNFSVVPGLRASKRNNTL